MSSIGEAAPEVYVGDCLQKAQPVRLLHEDNISLHGPLDNVDGGELGLEPELTRSNFRTAMILVALYVC